MGVATGYTVGFILLWLVIITIVDALTSNTLILWAVAYGLIGVYFAGLFKISKSSGIAGSVVFIIILTVALILKVW
jgi:hypothetical protein